MNFYRIKYQFKIFFKEKEEDISKCLNEFYCQGLNRYITKKEISEINDSIKVDDCTGDITKNKIFNYILNKILAQTELQINEMYLAIEDFFNSDKDELKHKIKYYEGARDVHVVELEITSIENIDQSVYLLESYNNRHLCVEMKNNKEEKPIIIENKGNTIQENKAQFSLLSIN